MHQHSHPSSPHVWLTLIFRNTTAKYIVSLVKTQKSSQNDTRCARGVAEVVDVDEEMGSGMIAKHFLRNKVFNKVSVLSNLSCSLLAVAQLIYLVQMGSLLRELSPKSLDTLRCSTASNWDSGLMGWWYRSSILDKLNNQGNQN